ncbi:MAG TPA: TonB family protein [Thermodesulfovibrionales bacterium]|nr:TonB family protein [Thermodesulfovibrionales bacterium]
MALKQSSRFVMPSPYIVNLVESEVKSEAAVGTQAISKAPEPEPAKKKEETAAPSPETSKKLAEREKRDAEKRIKDLKDKQIAIDKAKKLAELKQKMKEASFRGSAIQAKPVGSATTGRKRDGAVINNYIAGITSAIQRQYEITPDIVGKNLTATVFMRIMRDGSVQGARITSRSGNSTFDRCVLRAIAKASPVSPPPDGDNMEVEVTFHL